jgi:N-acyl-D-amino-acid deacylase
VVPGFTIAFTVRTIGIALAAAAAMSAGASGQNGQRAWTIAGADLADGTGAPLRKASVRIVGDRIAAAGRVTPQRGDTIVDGTGLVVGPGFIDIHNHSATELTNDPAAESPVAQGIRRRRVGVGRRQAGRRTRRQGHPEPGANT